MRRNNPKKLILIVMGILIALIVAVIICACALNSQATSTTESSSTTAMTSTTTATTTAQTTTETESTTPADTTAPVISGVTDRIVHIGETIAYKKNVVVTDDIDPAPKLEVDASGVDISTVGEYTVIYTATDASLNYNVVLAKIKVVPQESISTAQANALADDVLAGIITPDMTDSEKLDAVWWYVHELGYVDIDYGEPDEYLDNGFYFITRMMGNCRCVYGASRVLLERLGYQCIMMGNKKDAAQPHYWNLVSIDGGETWYHFDPVCWGWEEEYVICMVSDEWILAYSQWHNMEMYDWDPEGIPTTPEWSWDPDGFFGDRCLFDETGFYWNYYGDYVAGQYQGHQYPGYPYSSEGYSEEDYYYAEDYDDYWEDEYWDDEYYDDEYYEDEYYEGEETGEDYTGEDNSGEGEITGEEPSDGGEDGEGSEGEEPPPEEGSEGE